MAQPWNTQDHEVEIEAVPMQIGDVDVTYVTVKGTHETALADDPIPDAKTILKDVLGDTTLEDWRRRILNFLADHIAKYKDAFAAGHDVPFEVSSIATAHELGGLYAAWNALELDLVHHMTSHGFTLQRILSSRHIYSLGISKSATTEGGEHAQ